MALAFTATGRLGNTTLKSEQPASSRRLLPALAATFSRPSICCNHPDALKRRHEAESRRLARERERAEAYAKDAMGLKWWEGTLPPNMVLALSPSMLEILQQQANAAGRLCLINFFAEDCYTCRTLHAKLKKLAQEHSEVLFIKVNGSMEAMRPVFEHLGVTKVPYFMCVRDGDVVSSFTASLSPEKLALLRRELAAHSAPSSSSSSSNNNKSGSAAAVECERALVAA